MSEESGQQNFLFGTINYPSQESLEQFVNSITPEQALYLITQSLEMSHRNGIFNLNEAEVISKSIRVLNKEMFAK
jgi:hypothetical protein